MIAIADMAVVVSDARASASWWKQNLGFVSFTIGGSGHAVLIAPPGERYVLHLCEGVAPLEPGDTGIAFVTDEMDALVERMRQRSVEFPEPPRKEAWGRRAKFADPDGNIFWLLEVPSGMVRATLGSRAPSARPRHARRKVAPLRRRPRT